MSYKIAGVDWNDNGTMITKKTTPLQVWHLVKKYLNTLVQNETGKDAAETIQIDELNDFTYTATEKDGVLTGVTYKGTLVVNVPGSLLSSGEDATYDLDMNIDIEFVNPGDSVSIELPSTDGFEEVK